MFTTLLIVDTISERRELPSTRNSAAPALYSAMNG